MNRILLVEDDVFLRDGMTALFEKAGYSAFSAASEKEALFMLGKGKYDVIALDVMLPDGNGLDICRELRRNGDATPVVFITACDDENDIIAGLDAGADDYITKPFGTGELLARVRSLLRRAGKITMDKGDISLNAETMTVTKNGENTFVTPTEFQILVKLMRSGGAIVTRSSLLAGIWDSDGNYIDDNTLSVHISRIREKIGAGHIVTVRGIGYRWSDTL